MSATTEHATNRHEKDGGIGMAAGNHRVRSYRRRDGSRVRSHSRRSRGLVSWEHSRKLFKSAYRHRRDKPVAAIVGTTAILELALFVSLRGASAALAMVAVLAVALAAVLLYSTGRDMPQVTVGGAPPRGRPAGRVPPPRRDENDLHDLFTNRNARRARR